MFWKRKKEMKVNKEIRMLFILKRREDYSSELINGNYSNVATGMWNSSKFIVDMINDLDISGVTAKQVMVIDNNDIDREVTIFQATHVFIEGLWVIPEKFNILHSLHPETKWIIRIHSNTPFLSQEGVAIEWLSKYIRMNHMENIYIAANHEKMTDELKEFCGEVNPILYLPNYYEFSTEKAVHEKKQPGIISIGCFGAIRPLKNQLLQAMAAYRYAHGKNLTLFFFINSGRIECGADSIMKNIEAFFKNVPDAFLIKLPWMPHDEFLMKMNMIDISMQVSFSETFNIVTADAVSMGVPVVVSDEIPFIDDAGCLAHPTSSQNICDAIDYVLRNQKRITRHNLISLRNYNELTKKVWINYIMQEGE